MDTKTRGTLVELYVNLSRRLRNMQRGHVDPSGAFRDREGYIPGFQLALQYFGSIAYEQGEQGRRYPTPAFDVDKAMVEFDHEEALREHEERLGGASPRSIRLMNNAKPMGGDCPACSGTVERHGTPYKGGEVCHNDRTDRVRR